MENFEVIPGNPILQAKFEAEKLAEIEGYQIYYIIEDEEMLQFQVVKIRSSDGKEVGVGEEVQASFLSNLIKKSEVMNKSNSQLVIHPNTAISILFTPGEQ